MENESGDGRLKELLKPGLSDADMNRILEGFMLHPPGSLKHLGQVSYSKGPGRRSICRKLQEFEPAGDISDVVNAKLLQLISEEDPQGESSSHLRKIRDEDLPDDTGQAILRKDRVPGWKSKYELKKAELCGKIFNCCGARCSFSSKLPCLPCFCRQRGSQTLGLLCQDSKVLGPIEASAAWQKGSVMAHVLRTHTFELGGFTCNIISIVDFGSMMVEANAWQAHSFRLMVWNLEQHGFKDDAAFVNVYNKLHEDTWDMVEQKMACFKDMDEMSPVYQVAFIVTWGDRVKVVGQWKNDEQLQHLVMVGDHELGPPASHNVLCYGQPHGMPPVAVTIREGRVCCKDVFMMVPKDLPLEKLRLVAEKCQSCEKMASELLRYEEVEEGVWVAKFHNF